jgi:hypothetical protein
MQTSVSAPPTVRRMANGVIYGCCVAALVSVMLAGWFVFDSSSVENPRSITPSSIRRKRMASGSLTEARGAGEGASKATTSCAKAVI